MEEAPASSESVSPKGAFGIKGGGRERVTGEGQPYQKQQAQASVRQTPNPAPGETLGAWAGRSLEASAVWGRSAGRSL